MLNLFPEFFNPNPQEMNTNYLKGLQISLSALEQALDLWEESENMGSPWTINPNQIFLQRLAMEQTQDQARLN